MNDQSHQIDYYVARCRELEDLAGDAQGEAHAAEARVRELEAALQQSRDDHQGAVEKLRAVEARRRGRYCGCGWCCANNGPGVVPGDAHKNCSAQKDRAALASPVESDAEDAS